MTRLKDKVALITGGGNGIGRTSAQLFAQEGALVVVAELMEEAGRSVVEEIRASGGNAVFAHTDVTDEKSVVEAVRAATKAYGRLDVLYNNAGAALPGDGGVAEVNDSEIFWKSITLNLFSVWLCCRHAIPELIKAGGGSIINTASVTALTGVRGRDAYSASKGGVVSMTRSMAVHYAPQRIRVNAIAPTHTLTERSLERSKGRDVSSENSKNLLGPIQPIEVSSMAVYLASDESRVTTGQTFRLDSGFTIS